MIHAKNKPSERVYPTMCQYGELIVLFGGYNPDKGLTFNDFQPLNDVWILDTKKLKGNYRKMRKCKYCEKTRGETRLYKCKRCQIARYCSKYCQKRHWLRHKHNCK